MNHGSCRRTQTDNIPNSESVEMDCNRIDVTETVDEGEDFVVILNDVNKEGIGETC